MNPSRPEPFLTIAQSLSTYRAAPVGRALVGPTFAVWWHNDHLNGIMFWDRPAEEHVLQVTGALDAELEPGVVPHGSLIDARRVRAVDLGAFNALSRYVDGRREAFSRLVRRQALLRPCGLAGAAVAGFYAVLAPAYPVNVFTEPQAALHWLGIDEDDAPRIAAGLDELHAAATQSPFVVIALRAHLDQRLGASTIEGAAHALGTSTRQLQRRLRDARTSFQREQSDARVRAAKTMLLETDYDIKRIALELGCSLNHFAALFRVATRETPRLWRERQRS